MLWPLALLLPLLAVVALTDLRMLRIPNILPLLALALFGAVAILAPPEDLLFRIVVALVTFALCVAAFAFRLLGGGDVKMLAALMLFIPAGSLVLFLNIFAASLLVGIAMVLGLRRVVTAPGGWRGLSEPRGFPAGVAIALAGWAHFAALWSIGA